MYTSTRILALSSAVLALAGCSSSKPVDSSAPLAFVPADTPYVFANVEPTPNALVDSWIARMQPISALYIASLNRLLDKTAHANELGAKVARAVLDEVKGRDTPDKWRELGFRTDARVALYGIDLVPVVRLQLGDPAAFKAMIVRIETKVGQKLATARIGDQEYWLIDAEKLSAIAAMQGDQLVATVVPKGVSEPTLKRLLGIIKPDKSLLAAGALEALNTQFHYAPYGSGYLDVRRIGKLLSGERAGVDGEFAKALELPLTGMDATCQQEVDSITAHFPRVVSGYTELSAQRLGYAAQVELDSALAKQVMDTVAPIPGMDAPSTALLDVAVSLPVLKIKEFWLKQAQAIIDKPYQCETLKGINDEVVKMKTSLDQTIPPPLSNLLGARIALDKLDYTTPIPKFAAKMLLAADSPNVVLGMATLTVPKLKDLRLAPDGKPEALPAGTIPGISDPSFAAMNDKAIAIAIGAGEDAELGAFLAAPAPKAATMFRFAFDSSLYDAYGHLLDQIGSMLPKEDLEQQKQALKLYQTWLKRTDMSVTATPSGVVMQQVIDLR
jgi:hypothetical protein